jgi:hypothetical protein
MHLRFLLLATLLLTAVAASPAQAADTVLAPAANTAGITAYGGHVVLSRLDPATGMWSLVRWHAGAVDVLPVAPRTVPFDADAGPDADGNPVVVYSRCARDPVLLPASLAPSVDWQKARGCDVYALPLTGAAVARKLTAASSRTKSETTPSIWRGGVAFARHDDGAATPTLLYVPAGARQPRILGGGSIQTCSSRCTAANVYRGVDQLDIGPARATFVWRMVGGGVYGIGIGWELRATSLKGGASTLLGSGLVSGTCGFTLPSAPSALSAPISYLAAGADCDVSETHFATIDPVTGARGSAPAPGGLAAGLARDGETLYWLRLAGPAASISVPGAGSCIAATARCELVSSPLPTFEPQPLRPIGGAADTDLVRSDPGYRTVRGPFGVRLVRPPATVPCALSLYAANVYVGATWSGKRSVQVLRRDGGRVRTVGGAAWTRSVPYGNHHPTKLRRCGDSTRLTYVVKKGSATARVSFAVRRAAAPRG